MQGTFRVGLGQLSLWLFPVLVLIRTCCGCTVLGYTIYTRFQKQLLGKSLADRSFHVHEQSTLQVCKGRVRVRVRVGVGVGVRVRARARARARECTTFFSGLTKCDEHLCPCCFGSLL